MAWAPKSVAGLDAPLGAAALFPAPAPGFPRLPAGHRAVSLTGEWAQRGYQAAFRANGSLRGETVRRRGAVTGPNDPCPCGSRRK